MDADGGNTEPAIGEKLRKEPTKGVPHDDRRRIQFTNNAVVVAHDPLDVQLGEWGRISASRAV
jgi:hypothetical protein